MKANKLFFLIFSLLCSSTSFAFFCPSNFNQIEIGATIDKVQQVCGKPDKEETKDSEASGPQEWDYYLKQNTGPSTIGNQAQGSLKTSVAFDANGKVVNISVNGIGVGSTSLCGNPISIGSTNDAVKAACGSPSFTNKQETTSGAPAQVDKITTYTYNSNPPVTLTFMNGVLTGQK